MKLLALIKKEFLRFFSDPKLIFTMIFPGILIYAIYSVMGGVIYDISTEYQFRAYTVNMPESVQTMLETAVSAQEGWTLELEPTADPEGAKAEVKEGERTALLVFPENFEEAIASYSPLSGEVAPQVQIYYRSADTESSEFYTLTVSVLETYEHILTNKFDINTGEGYDLSGETGAVTMILGSILPFLVIALVFSSCMGVTLESVAGEKERGTLSTILVTSAKRSHIALGKVIPLSCVASIGALSSFLGIALSLPKLAGMSVGSVMGGYGFGSDLLLFLLILSFVPLIVAAISAVSTFSKSVKEASAYTSIVMIFVMILSIVSAFMNSLGAWTVAVPILNAVICMQGVLSMSYSVWQCLVSVAVNFVYTGLLVLLIAKMLSSERIMFGK